MRRLMHRAALLVALSLASTLFVLAPTADAHGKKDKADDVSAPLLAIVKLAPGADIHALAAEVDATGFEPLIESRGIYELAGNHVVTLDYKGKLHLPKESKEWLKDIEHDRDVVWAEIDVDVAIDDLRFHVWRFHVWQFNASSGLRGFTQPAASLSQVAFAGMQFEQAHESVTGEGVRIAVLDTGVDASHELLAGRIAEQYDLVDDDGDASEQANGIDDDNDGVVDDAHGHGTFVAGVIAQIAPDAQIYPIRVIDADGTGQIYALVEAIDMALEMDVDIINMSFGIEADHKIHMLEDALKRAKKAEVLIVAAAGNGGDDRRSYPAASKEVISVAASDETAEDVAHFSTRGKWVKLAAPGVRVVSAVPGGGYAEWTGTSMATPVVTALAALLYDADADGDPKTKDITKALYEGARSMQGKDLTENGVVDVLASLDRMSGGKGHRHGRK